MPNTFRHTLDSSAFLQFDNDDQLLEPVLVQYSYGYTGADHFLREQSLHIAPGDIDPAVLALMQSLWLALKSRIPAHVPIRLPHATVLPQIRPRNLNFIAQNRVQATEVPVAGLHYHSIVPELLSQKEEYLRVPRNDWTPAELREARRLQAWVRATAWRDYERLLQAYLHR